jgi:hypothetical protein
MFPSSGEKVGRQVMSWVHYKAWLRLALSIGPNWVGVHFGNCGSILTCKGGKAPIQLGTLESVIGISSFYCTQLSRCTFWKLDVCKLRWKGGKAPTQLGTLESMIEISSFYCTQLSKCTFWKLDVSILRWKGGKAPTQLGMLESVIKVSSF